MKLKEFKKLTPEEREKALYLMGPISYGFEEFKQCLRWHVLYKFTEVVTEVSTCLNKDE